MADAHAIEHSDHDYIGFDVNQWLLGLRFRLLTRLERFDEMRVCAESLKAVLDSTRDPVIKMVVHYTLAESGYFSNDRELTSLHASALADIARQHQSPYLSAYTQFSLGLSEAVSGRHARASEFFASALVSIRGSAVAPELESEILSHHALSLLRTGSVALSVSVAGEAMEIAKRRGNRFAECFSLLVLARALETRDGAKDPAVTSLSREAFGLLTVTAARVLRRVLDVDQPSDENEQAALVEPD
ncbi:MAG: hypothetical protein IPO19_09250 [Rhodoferax sp.]|nr:hypothetical protein [Rhodoferax sp.]